ncbi:uncharacterized protein LTR77_005651 [Saxophila tyrrhenica]|uniref:N-acetyltransferase domain-containing protein n=1 Tax=Saxophila tyrrhenica TaxID=1690608 RepID=A0AAV9P971_9PEZI|nr:hypothetical protein LTR77_005651 [Saxophila tyrrhenica]
MPVTISPLQRSDIPLFVRIELEAFRSHPRIPMLWPRGYTDDLYAYYESNKNRTFDDPECQFLKAVDDETGKMVAVSEWTFSLDTKKQAENEAVDPNGAPPANWPIDGNWELKRFFSVNSEKWNREWLKGQPYIELNFLVTDPEYQGKGAGTALLSWGVQQADKLGARMALESTPAGLSLYKRVGFRQADVIKADMKEFGWTQPYDPEAAKRVWMVRDPSPGSA